MTYLSLDWFLTMQGKLCKNKDYPKDNSYQIFTIDYIMILVNVYVVIFLPDYRRYNKVNDCTAVDINVYCGFIMDPVKRYLNYGIHITYVDFKIFYCNLV